MKSLLAVTLFLASHTALATDFDQTCLNRYRDATLSLVSSAHAFNEGSSNAAMFLAEFGMTETAIGATRVICTFEPVEIKECVRLYKKQYHKIRNNVDVIEITKGNQTHVRVGLVEAAVALVDLKCQ